MWVQSPPSPSRRWCVPVTIASRLSLLTVYLPHTDTNTEIDVCNVMLNPRAPLVPQLNTLGMKLVHCHPRVVVCGCFWFAPKTSASVRGVWRGREMALCVRVTQESRSSYARCHCKDLYFKSMN